MKYIDTITNKIYTVKNNVVTNEYGNTFSPANEWIEMMGETLVKVQCKKTRTKSGEVFERGLVNIVVTLSSEFIADQFLGMMRDEHGYNSSMFQDDYYHEEGVCLEFFMGHDELDYFNTAYNVVKKVLI